MNGSAVVPHEVIHAPGFSIAVAGYENDGETVKRFLPTEAAYIPVKENGYGNPDDAVSEEEDSESLIGQILSECQNVKGEVVEAKNTFSKELSDVKDEMTDNILYAKEELNNKYSNLKNELTDMGDALLDEKEARAAGDEQLRSELNGKVGIEEGKGLSTVDYIAVRRVTDPTYGNHNTIDINLVDGSVDSIGFYNVSRQKAIFDPS